MKLFRRGGEPPKKAQEAVLPTEPPPSPQIMPAPRQITLSAEQKDILEKPIDPRVDRILQEIYADKAAAEQALNARRIIAFPKGDGGESQIVQDKDGFWRIVPGPAQESSISLLDAL